MKALLEAQAEALHLIPRLAASPENGIQSRILPSSGALVMMRRLASGIEVGWIIDDVSITRDGGVMLPDGLVLERRQWTNGTSAAAIARIMNGTSAMPGGATGPLGIPTPQMGLDATHVNLGPNLVFRVVPRDPAKAERDIRWRKLRILLPSCAGITVMIALAVTLFWRGRRAQRLADLRTDFVAAVSHELRTPLASVRMLAELLEAGAVPAEERQEVEQTLAGEARRLHGTLDRMLRFGALSRGKLTAAKAPVRLRPLVDDAVRRAEAAHRGLEVVVDVEPTLEASLDAGLVGLALDNLLGNAVKYAAGSGPITVRARLADQANVAIDVIDRGPGLDERAKKRIFLPFERADGRLSRATEGTGVGLALVRGIARAHGGDATVESRLGAGATFTVRFPRS